MADNIKMGVELEVNTSQVKRSLDELYRAEAKTLTNKELESNLRSLQKELNTLATQYEKIKDIGKKANISSQISDKTRAINALYDEKESRPGETTEKTSSKSGLSLGSLLKGLVGIRSLYALVRKIVSQNEALTSAISNIFTTIGNILKPILDVIAGYISIATKWLADIFKVSSSTENNTSKTAKSLASFDTINNIDGTSSSDTSLGEAENKAKSIWDSVKAILSVIGTIVAIVAAAIGGIPVAIGAAVAVIILNIKEVGQVILGVFELFIGAGQGVIEGILAVVGGAIQTIWATLKTIFGGLFVLLTEGPKEAIRYIKDCWKKVGEFFSYIGSLFKALYNNTIREALQFICNGIKGIVNGFINFVNLIIDVFGGSRINQWNGWTVPKLANGGIAYGPTIAQVGEYAGASNNPEVIAPLSKLENMMNVNETNSLLRTLIERVDSIDLQPTVSVTDVGRAALKYSNQQARVMGGAY